MAQRRKYTTGQLQSWLFDKALQASSGRARNMVIGNTERSRNNTVIGKLYFFKYDPKHKDKLEKYDKFPMVFPLQPYSDGFLGLNLHYLSIDERASLLGKLMDYASNESLNDYTKLGLSYDLINSTRSLSSLARPCIKRYLFSHCRSRFIEVYPGEWDKAIELPVEDWVFKR